MIRIARNLIFGAIGGFLGWIITEPSNYLTPPDDIRLTSEWGPILAIGCVLGASIGLCIGFSEGVATGSSRMLNRSMVLGTATGFLGGLFGLMFGQAVYAPLAGLGKSLPTFIGFIVLLGARAIGWSLIGLFIGASQGLPNLSTKKMRNGAIGGFFGGAGGGAAFEIFAQMNAIRLTQAPIFPGEMLRLIGFTVTGASIGLFIGFVDELLKRAWIIRLTGAGEGRQYIISKPLSVIGRNEMADVPLFGDNSISESHALLKWENGRYYLEDQGSPSGTFVNGQRISKVALKDGDTISIGNVKFKFRDKGTALKYVPPSVYPDNSESRVPKSDHICQFCGSLKDTQGNCSCSIATTASSTTKLGHTWPSSQTQATETATAKLVCIEGPYSGQSFLLPTSGKVSIGRSEDRDISLSLDNTTSRSHASIIIDSGNIIIIDENSLNGTYVNGIKINQQTLSFGDIVQIGSNKFRVEKG